MSRSRILVPLCASAALLVPTLPAGAKDGGDAVRRSGSCSDGARWKLKAKADDGGLEVEFEVDSNRNGQRWSVTLKRNGSTVASGKRTTRAPSGSFSFERRIAGSSGTIVARATHAGQVCRGALTL